MHLEIKIEGQPTTVTAQQKGVFVLGGKPRFFTKAKVKKAQNALVARLAGHRPTQPLDGPLAMSVLWVFQRPKAMKDTGSLAFHTKRPDLDNLLKGVLDALEPAGWVTDDARICRFTCTKFYGSEPYLQLRVEVLPDAQ